MNISLRQLVAMRDYLRRGHKMDAVKLLESGDIAFQDAGEKYRINPAGDIYVKVHAYELYLKREELKVS